MKIKSPAKVNLYLEVLGKRSDGYHEIETGIMAVSLFDRLSFESASSTQIQCNHPEVPTGSGNLVFQAIDLLRDHTGRDQHVNVRIRKRIPPGSGLGGGSSNAAVTLRALNRLWDLSLDRSALMEMGKQIGSDVNFFLNGSAAVCSGRGENVESFTLDTAFHVLLILPEISCETPKVYGNTGKFLNLSDQRVTLTMDDVIEKVEAEERLFNRLREPAFDLYPELRDVYQRVDRETTLPVQLSGSGSALFLVSSEKERIEREKNRLESAAGLDRIQFHVVHSLSNSWTPFPS